MDLDCIELRQRYERQIARQSFTLYAFHGDALSGPSVFANTACLMRRVFAWLSNRHRRYRNSFSVWGKLSFQPWLPVGHGCTALYIGGGAATRSLQQEMYAWEERMGVEGADPRDEEDSILLCLYDAQAATLQRSKPIVAAFLPHFTNLEQDEAGRWTFTGMYARPEGPRFNDTQREIGRVFNGMSDIEAYFGDSVSIYLQKLPPATVSKLTKVSNAPTLGEDTVWNILMYSSDKDEVERNLERVKVSYGQGAVLW